MLINEHTYTLLKNETKFTEVGFPNLKTPNYSFN